MNSARDVLAQLPVKAESFSAELHRIGGALYDSLSSFSFSPEFADILSETFPITLNLSGTGNQMMEVWKQLSGRAFLDETGTVKSTVTGYYISPLTSGMGTAESICTLTLTMTREKVPVPDEG